MITQPNAHLEARSMLPPVQRHAHLPQRSPQPLNVALAGFQLLVGYAWLLAGVDKILLGTFPAQLDGLLRIAVGSDRLPGFFIAIVQGLVVPNAVVFGYFVEWGETLAGLGLLTAGLIALLQPLVRRYLDGTSAVVFVFSTRLLQRLAPLAAAGAGLLGLSYFLLDGAPLAWFAPGIAFGGAIDTGLFLALASAILVVSQFMPRHHRR
ncbi:MAG TPA: hypothetical protein VF043_02150 [Ktedonobacteraceae bacterium]